MLFVICIKKYRKATPDAKEIGYIGYAQDIYRWEGKEWKLVGNENKLVGMRMT